MRHGWTRHGLVVGLAATVACESSPVRWSDPVATKPTPGDTQLQIDSVGHVSWSIVPPQPAWPEVGGACVTTVRARKGAHALYGVWWSHRDDNRLVLTGGRSIDDGVSWELIVPVDTTDMSGTACQMPAPSIAVVADDVYVAYALKARDGTGVFFAHSMDGGAMFHAPVPVIYGDRLVKTAVASDGDRVAVAYEDPNGPALRIALAVSRTQGHIFEAHEIASPDDPNIFAPAAAIAGRMVAVGWELPPGGDHGFLSVVRVGRLEP